VLDDDETNGALKPHVALRHVQAIDFRGHNYVANRNNIYSIYDAVRIISENFKITALSAKIERSRNRVRDNRVYLGEYAMH
jgi:hypothetical protein